MVRASSEIATPRDSKPTGPPLNFFTSASKMRLSMSSKPFVSIPNLLRESFATSRFMIPFDLICANSRALLRMRFAILGVPLLLSAISFEAFSSIGIFNIFEDYLMFFLQ